MKRVDSSLIAFLFFFSIQNSARELSLHLGSVERRTLLLPTEGFELTKVESQFRELLTTKERETTILQAEMMDRSESVSLRENGYDDISYHLWKLLYENYETRIPPFATVPVTGELTPQ